MYGTAGPDVLLMPTWEIVHARSWKFQIPYLSRHARVATFDPRGNGRSDRPADVAAYDRRAFAADALVVLDKAGMDQAVVVSWCGSGQELIQGAVVVMGSLLMSALPMTVGLPRPASLPVPP